MAASPTAQPLTGGDDLVGPEYAELAAFFDRFAPEAERWRRRNESYHHQIEQVYRFSIPEGASVLEIGCGTGDLLAALRPRLGVGVDVSEGMIELARRRHPGREFHVSSGEAFADERTFDYIVLSDVTPFAYDLLALFKNLARHSHRRTRMVLNSYNPVWRPILALAESLDLKPAKPIRNWVTPRDIANLLELAGFDVVSTSTRILMPKQVPVLTTALNGVLGNVWGLKRLCLSSWIVARPAPVPLEEQTVSIVCPCRNEAGHVPDIVRRVPAIGAATELIFVEGGSTDDTRSAIERAIEGNPDRDISLIGQPGKGKGDAVRAGFDVAKGDVLMILDGDLSVLPEDLPKFYEALTEGRGEMINGSRLVYDLEPGAMRLLNMFGNKAFSHVFEAITRHHVKDTLCGTKVLTREDYDAIVSARSYFGDFDPFGDFDLLFGAARLNMKIVDMPVRYHPRAYGETNISRFRHGLLLLRMSAFAFWKFRVELFSTRAGEEPQARSSTTKHLNAASEPSGASMRSSTENGA